MDRFLATLKAIHELHEQTRISETKPRLQLYPSVSRRLIAAATAAETATRRRRLTKQRRTQVTHRSPQVCVVQKVQNVH